MKVETSAFSSDEITLTPEDVEALLRGESVKAGAVIVTMAVTELTRRIGFDARFLRETMKPR